MFEDPKNLKINEDLPDWGPYGKEYVGLSHVAECNTGVRWDCFTVVGHHRRRNVAPYARRDAQWHPWRASAALNFYEFRYELEWKDHVFTDVSYFGDEQDIRYARIRLVNNTDLPQSLDIHVVTTLAPNPKAGDSVKLPQNRIWVSALDYQSILMQESSFRQSQTTDAKRPGQATHPGTIGGKSIGGDFLSNRGDCVSYNVHAGQGLDDAMLVIRYHRWTEGDLIFKLSGIVNGEFVLPYDGEVMSLLQIPVGKLESGESVLNIESNGGSPLIFDGFCLLESSEVDSLTFEPSLISNTPEVTSGASNSQFEIRYPGLDECYTLTFEQPLFYREYKGYDLPGMLAERANDWVKTNHVGIGEGCYSCFSLGAIPVSAHGEYVFYMKVSRGEEKYSGIIGQFVDTARQLYQKHEASVLSRDDTGMSAPLGHACQLTRAILHTNIVYPVGHRHGYIKHYTPGRWWDSLYSWDCGMYGIGLACLSPKHAMDLLEVYLLPDGDPYAAWVEHGTPLPTQIYHALEVWNHTFDETFLAQAYPSLRQFYEFLIGRGHGSLTSKLKSGLLHAWDYFYNSGGWDDYPPQWYLKDRQEFADRVTPCVLTAHTIRFAKVLSMMAKALGRGEDLPNYEEDIQVLSHALNEYAWDEDSGYYGYVEHDENGNAAGFLKTDSGEFFNKGMDGVSPLVAGIANPERTRQMVDTMFDPEKLWTEIGLSTVDQSAGYYESGGYWNGSMWIPHQWFFWKSLLGLAQGDQAWRLAKAVIDVWVREINETYHSFELFKIDSGRGSGWHQFAGLSAPIISMISAYYRPGCVTAGYEVWLQQVKYDVKCQSVDIILEAQQCGEQSILVSLLNAGDTIARFNGEEIQGIPRTSTCVEFVVNADVNMESRLSVESR